MSSAFLVAFLSRAFTGCQLLQLPILSSSSPAGPLYDFTPTCEGQLDVLSCLCPSVGAQVERHHLMRAPL